VSDFFGGFQAVLDGIMALVTLHFVIAHVYLVEKRGIADLENLRRRVASLTPCFLHPAFSPDNVEVALGAIGSPLDQQSVFLGGKRIRHAPDMARAAIAKFGIAGTARLGLEMADITDRLGDHHVCSLNDLRVATRAAQDLPTPQTRQMVRMVERNAFLEFDRSFQRGAFMAAALETVFVGNFRPGLRTVSQSNVANELRERDDLAANETLEPGLEVADQAIDVLMVRRLPRVIVWVHYVAIQAEFWFLTFIGKIGQQQQ
jgi:hypothetical protein